MITLSVSVLIVSVVTLSLFINHKVPSSNRTLLENVYMIILDVVGSLMISAMLIMVIGLVFNKVVTTYDKGPNNVYSVHQKYHLYHEDLLTIPTDYDGTTAIKINNKYYYTKHK